MTTPSALVFLIDDDASVRKGVSRLLRAAGYKCETFASATGFLAREPYGGPTCLIVDVRMPGLNGYQFVRALRGDRETAETPIVILSALVQDREQLAGMLTGADAYLIKPVKIVDLVDAIDRAVHLSEEERTAYTRQLFGQ